MSATDLVIDDIIRQNPGSDPHNRLFGGEPTHYGMTVDLLRAVRGGQASQPMLEALSEEEARLIYHQWIRAAHFDRLRDHELLYWVVDAARHHGAQTATRLLLLAACCSSTAELGKPWDSATINALPPHNLMRRLQAHRLHVIAHIIANHPERAEFAPAWIDHVCSVFL